MTDYQRSSVSWTPFVTENTPSSGADLEIDMKVLAWLGNQLRPESLFQKDLDIDPFIASTPEAIQAEYEDMQVNELDITPQLKCTVCLNSKPSF